MMTLRRSTERGYAQHGWLESWHSFSFAEYHDPAHTHFASLRVINEDIVQPGAGFGMHPHRDMEILTYILDGALRHQDSMGNSEQLRAGEVQVMSAGTGVTHSEVNASNSQAVHLLQIWIMPARHNLLPGYQQKLFNDTEKRGRWCLLAAPDQTDGSLLIHQDVRVYAALLDNREALSYQIQPGRKIYLHAARGKLSVNGQVLDAGDALMVSDATQLNLESGVNAEILLFDLA